MRNKGSIVKFSTSKGGFGEVLDETNLIVHFEQVECNYEYVRVGDEVLYDLVQIYDGSYEALNIDFRRNKILSEIDSAYQNQRELDCKVIFKTANGFVVDYKEVNIYLPNKELGDKDIAEGTILALYIKNFSYNSNSIASINKNSKSDVVTKFQKHIGKSDSFDFEIIDTNSSGINVKDNKAYGFIPNSHLGPIEKKTLNQGDIVKVSVIGCSLKSGLVLSFRNHLLYEILVELNDAFNNEISLTGEIKSISSKYVVVNYKGIDLILNKKFLLHNFNIEINHNLGFKIIDFSWINSISISTIETTENGILNSLRNRNKFIGEVKQILENGLLVSINEFYTGFMPNAEITENWKLDLNRLNIGAKIKASIYRFNFKGLYLSRLQYLKKSKRERAADYLQINESLELKIQERMGLFGILVSNETIKGLIPLENILPKEVIEQIDKLKFIKYCKDIFKRRELIICIVSVVDKINNKINFDLDYQKNENIEKVKKIVDYFEYNNATQLIVKDFYNIKCISQSKN